jgi:broad specificity phosphatase PhoE
VNTYYFLRHAETEINLNLEISKWKLSNNGNMQAKNLVNDLDMRKIDFIYSSLEDKTFLTVQPLAKSMNLGINRMFEFNELQLGEILETREEFMTIRKKMFTNLHFKHKGISESSIEALTRFKAGIKKLNQDFENNVILICSHGTILSLYFADLLNILTKSEIIYDRWNNLSFCVWGKVIDEKVITDFAN